ncbi:tyrosine-type recombinase/integrase [Rhizobium sp. Leaf386]|uniref:tyrosine-type recombinase/integrase n=1 Tax=Rhizobium sp. Leaf386 TaxID=1736359 RepID=UPI00071241E0|nr:tyrosine-type recombinase/integrase [Rhizobium sp. Leaf386]KQT01797.1 hypothetical protein ASG50_19100 [Rhizobium sp. Leaf386]
MNQFVTPSLVPTMGSLIHLPDVITFDYAAASYMENGGNGKFLPRIIEHFHGRPLASIFPFDLQQMANVLYPDVKNSTKNRQALTPARAVISHGYDRGWCPLMRLRRFKEEKPEAKKPASPLWLQLFARQCDKDGLQHVAALILFMAFTGARVSEALRLEWPQVDLANRTATLLRTKTSENSVRHLIDGLVSRMHGLRETKGKHTRVFRFKCRHSVNERIKAVCERADIEYKPSHECGRHAFATNAMEAGMDIKTVMAAGGWESIDIFLGTYVNPHQDAGRLVADRFNHYQFGANL